MSNIQVGDEVSWTHVSGSVSRTLSMDLREGVVMAINDKGVATIKPPKKHARLVRVHVRRLRLPGQPSQISEFIEGIREAHHAR